MKQCMPWLLIGFCMSLAASPSQALINTADNLVLSSGETLTLSGTIYKNVSITVYSGAGIFLPAGQDADSSQWSLQLVAPSVYIGGTLCADGVSFNTSGIGQIGSLGTSGPGGSGFGNTGGNGNDSTGSGGYGYGPTYQAATGSMGLNSPYGGGGSIRIDAMTLTITSSALLLARGSLYQTHTTGGGGSGGSILINAVSTRILYPVLDVDGGPGQLNGLYSRYNPFTHSYMLFTSYGGGGGACGKIKFFVHPNYYINYEHPVTLHGGAAGGGNATAGGGGTSSEYTSYSPSAPSLLSPDDGQTVGLQPTLNFSASDNQASEFIQYWIRIYPEGGSNTVNGAQWDTSAPGYTGWNGVRFNKSGQMASYRVPWRLESAKTYHWVVWATNTAGYNYSSSSTRTFVTTNNNPPITPVLASPTASQTNVVKTPKFIVFSADPDGNSLTFSITLSRDPGLANPKILEPTYVGWDKSNYPSAYNYEGINAFCQLSDADALEPGKTYYWQATVYDQLQEASTSTLGTFSVVPLPSVPALNAPANQGVVTTATPVFQMTSTSAAGAALRYKLEISSDDFQTAMTYTSENSPGWSQPQYASGQTASLQIPAANALSTGQTYQWRVRAYDTYGSDWSRFSDPQTFTVVTPPNLPQLISPENNFSASGPDLEFSFSAASGAGNTLTYRFELSSDGFAGNRQIFDQASAQGAWSAPQSLSGATVTFKLPATAALSRGKPYQWRVLAWDGHSWSPPSDARTFSLADSLEIRESKLYPNPAVSAQVLHVMLSTTVNADITLRLFNTQAKEIRRETWSIQGGQAATHDLNIASLAPGAYFAVLEVASPFGTKKITKRFAVVN